MRSRPPREFRVLVGLGLMIFGGMGCTPSGAPEPRFDRIVFVLADALRVDHLGIAGYGRDTSPHIDRLAREGVFFGNMLAHSSHTVPAVAALLTGAYPGDLGIEYWPKTKGFDPRERNVPPQLPAEAQTLAERLSDAGFDTTAVVANPWLQEQYGFAQGYDQYIVAGSGPRALRDDGAAINEIAYEVLAQVRERPLFLYLHYLDTHNPYGRAHVPARYRPEAGSERYRNGPVRGLSSEDLRHTEALYDEGIRYFDGLLGNLRGFLEARGLLDRTLVVLVSDHGDEFHEHGGLGHGRTLYNEVVRSFAVFWSPGLEPGESTAVVEGIDVAPTVLRLAGVEPFADASGTGLLDRNGRIVTTPSGSRFTELGPTKAVVDEGWKLIVSRGRPERFFEVGDELSLEHAAGSPPTATAENLRERLAEHVKRSASAGPVGNVPRQIDAPTKAALEALGYLER